jgi:methyl-accepting chemotaxis protein
MAAVTPYLSLNKWRRGKRLLDLALTLALLVLMSPVFALCWLSIRLTSDGPALHWSLRIHTSLLSVYDRLGVLARSEDSARLLKESTTLRKGLLDDSQRTSATFNHLPPEMKVDQTVLPTLESIERTLPSHLDAITSAAESGDWGAVRFRIERQVQPLESLSSELVKDVTREVEEQRAQAAQNISRAERRIFLAVPITGFVTLLIAAGLGVVITRSITEPLGRLVEGSKALARGEFEHQISVIGADELAHLGLVFNDTSPQTP